VAISCRDAVQNHAASNCARFVTRRWLVARRGDEGLGERSRMTPEPCGVGKTALVADESRVIEGDWIGLDRDELIERGTFAEFVIGLVAARE
jgi:hypothetical protein